MSKIINIKKIKKDKIFVTKIPYNPFYEKFIPLYLKLKKSEKNFVLILLKYTEKSGASLRKGIVTKIRESKSKKDKILEYILYKVLYYMDIRGLKIVDALYKGSLISFKEFSILSKTRTFADGIDQIVNMEKRNSTLILNNMLLIMPMYLALLTLLFSFGTIKSILTGMVKPIRDAGGTPPPLPHYMQDITTYAVANIIAFSILAVILGIYYYTKHRNIPLYFKIFKFNEQEIILDILYNIESLTKSGINITDTVSILMNNEKNNVKKEIYSQIYQAFEKGNIQLSTIFEYYNVNYQTIGLITTGEETRNIIKSLSLSYLSLKEMFALNMKIYGKFAFYGGQILMGIVILKPIIDILLFTSIQQLNFSTN